MRLFHKEAERISFRDVGTQRQLNTWPLLYDVQSTDHREM